MKRGIIAEDVPILVGRQQAVVLQTRQVLSLYLYNMLRISFAFCSLHLGTNNCIYCLLGERRLDFGMALYLEVVVIFSMDKC